MNSYPNVAPGVEWVDLDGQVLILDSEQLFLLDHTASSIWQALDGRTSLEGLVRGLAQLHPTSSSVEAEARSFLADLVARRLVVLAPAPCVMELSVPPHVAWTEDQGRVLLVDLRTGGRYAFSESGSLMWLLVVQGLSRQELLDQLEASFADIPDDFAASVRTGMESLVEWGLLLRVPNAGPRVSGLRRSSLNGGDNQWGGERDERMV